ncbi:MAG TPA: hypothetical protein VFN10_06615 [Thermoanaerobaculia bacterium]|nr:hypothetical protein [Thermoanaerobaculia bacterium]
MKKLGVAAALTLCAAGAFASNFRAADQVYVPVAGHAAGQGALFLSDIVVANVENEPVDVSVIFSTGPGGTQQEFKNLIHLAANERKEYVDFVGATLGQSSAIGQIVFNACAAGQDCGPATQIDGVSPFFKNITVESRIYSIPTGSGANPPTSGQDMPGIPWYNFVSTLQSGTKLDKVMITGIRQTGGATQAGTYRANIGLVNASQYSRSTMVVSLYQMNGTKIAEHSETLEPLGFVQKNISSMPEFSTFTGSGWVTVEQRNVVPVNAPSDCTQGCPAFLAYGSVLDNVTNDATTLEAQYLVPMDPAALAILYPGSSGKASIRRSVRH